MQVSTAEFRKGLRIVFDGEPYTIVDFQHVKPGKGGAFVRTKLKHMRQGKVIDNTFRAGEKVVLVDFEDKHMQFLYKDDRYNFMDMESYDQVSLSADEVGEAREYLKENTEVEVSTGDLKVRLSRGVAGLPAAVAGAHVAPPHATVIADVSTVASSGALVTVEAPMVGTFYRASAPSADPYVREGDDVKEGQI